MRRLAAVMLAVAVTLGIVCTAAAATATTDRLGRRARVVPAPRVVTETTGNPLPVAAPLAGETASRPNIVVIMTDDQTTESLRVMPKTRALIGDAGTTFSRAFVSYPLCCPSRVTYFTGQYAHNHKVLYNSGTTGGYHRYLHRHLEDTSFPVALERAGYSTTHIGKYINGYGYSQKLRVPPGWTNWMASVDPSTYQYRNVTLNMNGTLRHVARHRYATDVYTDLAVQEIEAAATRPEPFFLDLAYLAPHSVRGETSGLDPQDEAFRKAAYLHGEIRFPAAAAKYEDRFPHVVHPRDPSYDEADVSDKPSGIRERRRLNDADRKFIRQSYRLRLQSLLSVDDGVARIVDALERTGQLDDTYIVFVSDNGFFHGEHRITYGKYLPYEPSISVPLLVRGPGIAAGQTVSTVVGNVDLAPTILELTGAQALMREDGESLVPLLRDPSSTFARPGLLIESGKNDNDSPVYSGIRTTRYKYVEYESGEKELYDLRRDPGELRNRAGDAPFARRERELAAALDQLRACAGARCRAAFVGKRDLTTR